MNPLVSVITITYNCINAKRKDTLVQCIESAANQTYDNIEHIIIDGASSDGTLDILMQYSGLKVYSEPDSGVFNAFNKGILKANGKYIVFINSDDFFSSNDAVKVSVEALEKSGADYSYGNTWLLNEDNHKKSQMRIPQLYKSFVKMPFCHQSMFCRTDVLKKIGMFDENNKIASDYEVYLKLLLGKYIGVRVNSQIATFRCGGVSGNRKLFEQEMCNILKKHLAAFYNLTDNQAYNIIENSSIPLSLAFRLSGFIPGKDKYIFIFSQIRHFLFQIRTSKDKKMLKIFGLYLVKPKCLMTGFNKF